MPQIPQFDVSEGRRAAAADALRPSEEGIEALQQGARNISRLTMERAQMQRQSGEDIDKAFTEAGRALDSVGEVAERHQTLSEISSMGPAHAALFSNLTDQLSKAANSNDPNAIQQFKDNLETQLDQFQSTAVTPGAQAHAIGMAEQTRDHFTTALTAEQTIAASHKVVSDLGTTTNILAGTVAKDPAALPAAIQLANTHIDELVANHAITPTVAADLRDNLRQKVASQLAGSAVASVIHGNPDAGIDSNPDAGRRLTDQYSQYLTPEQQNALRHSADVQDRMNVEQQKFDTTQARQVENDAGKEAITGVVNDVFATATPDYKGAMTTLKNAMALPGNMRDPTLGMQTFRLLNTLQESQAAGKQDVSDPATLTALQHAALLPADDPGHLTTQDLYQAKFDHKVSNTDFAFLNKAMQQSQKSDLQGQMDQKLVGQFLNQAADHLHGGTGPNATSLGQPDYSRFMTWFVPNLAAAQAKGESPSQFVDSIQQRGPEFLDSFKVPSGANAGSGLFVQGGGWVPQAPGQNTAKLPPPANAPVNSLFEKWFSK